jgi:hypothetical protein
MTKERVKNIIADGPHLADDLLRIGVRPDWIE